MVRSALNTKRDRGSDGLVSSERLDILIHPPAWFQLMVLLKGVSEMEFSTADDMIGVSGSVLSEHFVQRAEGEYHQLRKATANTRVPVSKIGHIVELS
jgi:hypothetical protein